MKECLANAEVVISGLCNIYTHYITTYEEYQVCILENTSKKHKKGMVFTVHGAPRYISDPKKYASVFFLYPHRSSDMRALPLFLTHTLSRLYIQLYRGLAKAIPHVTLRCLTVICVLNPLSLMKTNFLIK